jgi:hypothetical protein
MLSVRQASDLENEHVNSLFGVFLLVQCQFFVFLILGELPFLICFDVLLVAFCNFTIYTCFDGGRIFDSDYTDIKR